MQISNLSKTYGTQPLFDDVTFIVNKGERIGIVGRNGHGKSTLFKLILGDEDSDSGSIQIPRDYSIGHLSQKISFTEKTVLDEACLGIKKNDDGWVESHKAEAILQGLGFQESDFQLSPDKLSGGFQVRLNLAKLLLSEPNLLLLDEPTNYLDIVTTRWLVQFLRNWNGELMIITHDRGLMDQVTTHTLAIHRARVKKVAGGTKKLYTQLAQEEEIHEKTRVNQQKKREKTEEFINRFRAKASKAAAVQSKVKALAKLDQLEELSDIANLSFKFNSCPFPGRYPLHVKDLEFGYGEEEALISKLSFSLGKNDRIAVIGKNGKGKTTLLNLIADELKPRSGDIEFADNSKVAYFGQTNVDRLDPKKTIEEEILSVHPDKNRTAVRSICGAMMFSGDLAEKRIGVLSGGERARTLLGKVLVKAANVLLLDEPTNHLDFDSANSLLEAIKEFPGAVMLVTHDEYFLKKLATRLIIFQDGSVSFFEGGYEDFIRRVGWSGEAEPKGGSNNKDGLNKKEQRKKRAAEQKKKKEILRPIEKKIEAAEASIIEHEEKLEKEQTELIDITKDGYGDDAQKLARSIHDRREAIEALFADLEQLSEERKVTLKQFESPSD